MGRSTGSRRSTVRARFGVPELAAQGRCARVEGIRRGTDPVSCRSNRTVEAAAVKVIEGKSSVGYVRRFRGESHELLVQLDTSPREIHRAAEVKVVAGETLLVQHLF